jgi:hypothetical protein
MTMSPASLFSVFFEGDQQSTWADIESPGMALLFRSTFFRFGTVSEPITDAMFAMAEALSMCKVEGAHERKGFYWQRVGIVPSPSLLLLTSDFRFQQFQEIQDKGLCGTAAAGVPTLTKREVPCVFKAQD